MTIPKLCCIPCPSVCRSSGLSHSTLQKYYCQRPFAGSKKQPISYSLKSIDSGFSMRQLVCIGFQHSFQRFIAILKVYISCQPHKINTQRKSKFGQSVANQLIECSLRFVFLWGRANEIPPRSQTAQKFSYHLITPVTGVNFLLNGSVSVICVILHSSR